MARKVVVVESSWTPGAKTVTEKVVKTFSALKSTEALQYATRQNDKAGSNPARFATYKVRTVEL